MRFPDPADIREARERIRNFAHRTPVISSDAINRKLAAHIYFKCENLQKVGAFKFRGACNAVFALSDAQARRGVVAHSSGNHAQALALAARLRNIPAYIVMPENAPQVKKSAVAEYGARITFCRPTLAAREQTQSEIIADTGAVEIHPYDNPKVVAGQATAAEELLDEVPELDTLIAPVGGGGLLGGTALSAKARSGKIRVIGVEPSGADDAARSLQAGHIIPSVEPKTVADGLLTSLGQLNFAILREYVDAIETVDDELTIRAMKYFWERTKLIIEPSAATAVAFLLKTAGQWEGRKVGVILSGGNVDLDRLPWLP
jgi:threonine dehydratase